MAFTFGRPTSSVMFKERPRSGWGVVRVKPWRLAGIYPTRKEAEERRARLGDDYVVRFGDGWTWSDDFFWDSKEGKDGGSKKD